MATLVAQSVPPDRVFAAVTAEAGRLLGAHQATMSRYGPDGTMVVAAWGKAGAAFPVGSRWSLRGRNVPALVFQTGRPARIDDYTGTSGHVAEAARKAGLRSAVAVPISVEGHLWGVILVGSTREEPLRADTEARLAGFTELAAAAIANTRARVDLDGFAHEQAALRRVATLVAQGASPEEVFTAVTEEVGRLFGAHHALMSRYGPKGGAVVVAAWSGTSAAFPVGTQWVIGGQNLHTMVFRVRQPARIDQYTGTTGPAAEAQRMGVRSGVRRADQRRRAAVGPHARVLHA